MTMSHEMIDTRFYEKVRGVLEEARGRAYSAVNFAMVEAYWHIGGLIAEQVGDRAEYGAGIIRDLSRRMTREFGKGFDTTNLGRMRQFHLMFPNIDALRQQLTWSRDPQIMAAGGGTRCSCPAGGGGQ